MERLTVKRTDGRWALANNDGASNLGQLEKIPRAIDRLATIENILGDDYDLDHLRELVRAEKDGRLVALPCKVGDFVWIVFTPKHPANPADKGKWVMVEDGVQRILYGAKGMSIETWNMGTYPVSKLGKTVFLTRKEAEAALEKERKKEEQKCD